MSIKDKLPLINSGSKITRIIGYIVYCFVFLIVLGAILPHNTENVNESTSPTTTSSNAIHTYHGFGNYTYDSQDMVSASVKKATDIIHLMGMSELPDTTGYTKDSAQYTITSTGSHLKGYIDYTNDGYAVVLTPKRSSLTKGDFADILGSFYRTD